MSKCQTPFPAIWLVSDERNDHALAAVLARLPRGSGLIFRHYHLPEAARKARFKALSRHARQRGHTVILAGTPQTARAWGADGAYGPAAALAQGPACLRLATVHSLQELGRVRRADAVLLSPVYPTRSHPGGKVLGRLRFLLIARQSRWPVIALGGMTKNNARMLCKHSWAAIDGLC